MLRRALAFAGVTAMFVAAAGCGGSGTSTQVAMATPTPSPTATIPINCLPPQVIVVLAYPIPGSTGVSTAIGQIVVASSPALASFNYQVQVVPPSGTPILGGFFGAAPSPVPSPIAPPPSGLTLGAATIPALAAATTYQVRVQGNPPCLAPQTIGSFTTA